MKKILLLSAVLILTLQRCSSPTDPPSPPVKPVKDPRTYTWTVDTLFYTDNSFQTNMGSIWGSSPDNMYTVGHSDDIRGQAWHYDGKQWIPMNFPNIGDYSLRNIYGFSANDIWVVGARDFRNPTPPPNFLDSSLIIHNNGGVAWNYIRVTGGKTLNSVWGSSPNDVWFGGLNATLFHWDGTSVKRDSIPFFVPQYTQIYSIYGRPTGETYFLLSSPTSAPERAYLFLNKQNNWSLVDSSASGRKRVWVSEKGDLYESGATGFYKWTGGSWTNLLGWFNGQTFGISATSENNLFTVGITFVPSAGSKYFSGLVYHYNGKDFYLYENLKLNDVVFYDVWTDGNEVFVVGQMWSPQKTIILHGK